MLADALSPLTSSPPPSSKVELKGNQPVVMRASSTTVFYEATAAALGSNQVVWDFGCGSGLGSALLRGETRQVVGIDPDAPSVTEVVNDSRDLRFVADVDSAALLGAPDVVIVADVLGYLETPIDVLFKLARHAKPTTQLLIFEPRANVTQQLPFSKHRAYSAVELVELTDIHHTQR
jgi:2-polyprenyl-3-methyl-5-hydroxy-6-metoxy-1,4-benzoquinol methylase